MSYGSSGGVHFAVQKNSSGPGIFWQRDKPKNDPRKFGYKSKNLRHPIRKPDEEAALEALEAQKEVERKKFNKSNKDFIRNNKDRFKPREDTHAKPGTQHITPGTVTLTQEQLAALLASLGKTVNTDEDNPLKISFDASTNKIEVERYESSGSGDEEESGNNRHTRDDDDDDSDVGIAAFLNEKKEKKPKAKKKATHEDKENLKMRENHRKDNKEREERKSREGRKSREEPRPKASVGEPSHRLSVPDPQPESRLSWEDAKKEAGVSHVPDLVPWKHLTVGERKRLQWAREKAEVPEEYNPWGRPGAGAPQQKVEEETAKTKAEAKSRQKPMERQRPDIASRVSNIDTERKRKQEEISNEIEKLRREIQEAEEKQREEEERIKKSSKSKSKQREEESSEQIPESQTKQHEKEKVGAKKESRDRSQRKSEKKEEERKENGANGADNQVQIVIVRKKKQKLESKDEDSGGVVVEMQSSAEEPFGRKEKKERKNTQKSRREDGDAAETPDEGRDDPRKSSEGEKDGRKEKQSSDGPGPDSKTAAQDETAHLSKKEIERRKWLAELDKQREEQRMRKQAEKEKDRAGLQDQWADRFVYNKTAEHISPRKPQVSHREPVSVLGQASEPRAEVNAPPAAMRSALVVGTGTLNENRYNDKKAEEKRRWLEELEKQREEQRLAKVAQKERERQQDDGTWADRYQTDHKKLMTTNEIAMQGGASPQVPVAAENQRTSSAPGFTEPVRTSGGDAAEPTTFLRGQGAFVDPVTRREQEEKRRVYLEYQAQVKAQIEEKERQKREERERKVREDMEEERKLQAERDLMQKQLDMEQRKTREREELRQKQIAVLKNAMDEAQEKAQEEKNLKRIHHLQEKGHDVSHLKATYEANTPRMKEYELTSIPGLGEDSSRELAPSPPPPAAHGNAPTARRDPSPPVRRHAVGQSYTKDPYVENRVLTPSRFRDHSKPHDDPNSPRREFGTQTLELKDLQAILNSLPDEVQIEYKMKVEEALKEKARERQGPSRKVHVKSADEAHHKAGRRPVGDSNPRVPRKTVPKQAEPEAKKKPLRLNERPAWNANRKKSVVKNSEKDPFYNEKREEKEMRKVKRERQLQYLQELNKEKIPSLSRSPGRSRDVSPEGAKVVGERGRKPGPTRKVHGAHGVENHRDSSPNILSLTHTKEQGGRSKSPKTTGRSSPLIPTVRHRAGGHHDDPERDPYSYTNSYLRSSQTESRYGDIAIAPAADGDFLPFMRTTEILDPSKADEPMAISRENSRMERARRAYMETHNPANKGRQLDVYQDREREAALKASQDPIMNPSRVTDHPTARQDRILQQLSSLKQTLMARQKELENYMEPAEEETVRG